MDNQQATFARLFFLNPPAIDYIKTKLSGPAGQSGGSDFRFSKNDAKAVKNLIEVYHKDADGKKMLFLYKPFDIRHDHACILITDANLAAEVLTIMDPAKQKYALEIWPNCAVIVTEQMLAPSEGIFYHLPLLDVSNVFHQMVGSLNLYPIALQGDARVEATSKRSTLELYPLPELFHSKGWTFKHFGYCALLEPINYGNYWITDASSSETKPIQVNLIKNISVTMYRAVNLKFFDKFRQSRDSSHCSQLQLLADAASSALPSPITSPVKVIPNTMLESLLQSQIRNPSSGLPTILQEEAQEKAPFSQNQQNLAHQAQPQVSNRFYQQPEQKQKIKACFPNSQMVSHESLGPLLPPPVHQQQNENTMQVILPSTLTVSSPQITRLPTVRSNSLTDSILTSRNANNDIELLHFSTAWRRKMLTKISGNNFSVSFSKGCRSFEVSHNTQRRVTPKFARKALQILENGFKIEEMETRARVAKFGKFTDDNLLNFLDLDDDIIESENKNSDVSEPSSTTSTTLEVQHRNLIANYISTTGSNLNTMPTAGKRNDEASQKRKSEAENGQIVSEIVTKKARLSTCTTTSSDTDSASEDEDSDTRQNEIIKYCEQQAHKVIQDVALDLTNKRH